uniref:hypothetical protein n=1 Tax=Amycolatopsis sp. CA-293810 TaxID=3239926 RepID=UPI003F49864B
MVALHASQGGAVKSVIVAAGSHVEPSLPDREVVRAVLAETRRFVLGSSFGEQSCVPPDTGLDRRD